MDAILYQFDLTAIDTDALLPQAAAALEKHTELKSRQKYPAMWARTDKARQAHAAGPRSSLPRTLLYIACIAMGVFLLVPGLMQPRELAAPLFAGILGIVTGVWGLARRRVAQRLQRSQSRQHEKAAARMLTGKTNLQPDRYTVIFTADGFAVADSADGDRLDIPYPQLECVVGTADIFMLFYGSSALLLQRRDLTVGNAADFSTFIAEKAGMHADLE